MVNKLAGELRKARLKEVSAVDHPATGEDGEGFLVLKARNSGLSNESVEEIIAEATQFVKSHQSLADSLAVSLPFLEETDDSVRSAAATLAGYLTHVVKSADTLPVDPTSYNEDVKLLDYLKRSPKIAGEYATVIEKRAFSTGERARDAASGAALPDGSFPIENGGDLANAIQAIGRAKNPAKARAHIMSRARSLGLTDKIPDSWVSKAVEEFNKAVSDLAEVLVVTPDTEIAKHKGISQSKYSTLNEAYDHLASLVNYFAPPQLGESFATQDAPDTEDAGVIDGPNVAYNPGLETKKMEDTATATETPVNKDVEAAATDAPAAEAAETAVAKETITNTQTQSMAHEPEQGEAPAATDPFDLPTVVRNVVNTESFYKAVADAVDKALEPVNSSIANLTKAVETATVDLFGRVETIEKARGVRRSLAGQESSVEEAAVQKAKHPFKGSIFPTE